MSESPSKKHKKHKKHKHKRKREEEDYDGVVNVDVGDGGEDDVDVVSTGTQPIIKLKIKLGGHTTNIKKNRDTTIPISVPVTEPVAEPVTEPVTELVLETEENSELKEQADFWDDGRLKGEDVFTTKKAGGDISDEEKEWLDALEAGTLDDSGALKKQLDESLLTSRQRARIHGNMPEELVQLPSGYKEPIFTPEQLQRRQQRAEKRRVAAFEKQEKDKKQTVDRLLKKQDSTRGKKSRGAKRNNIPGYRYCSNSTGNFVCVPHGFQLPFEPQKPICSPTSVVCGVDGCSNQKRYACSKTGVPLCSLDCYKRNLIKHKLCKPSVIAVTT